MTTLYPFTRLPQIYYRAFDDAGVPLPGALLYFYVTDSATPLDTYADADHNVVNDNPVEADQAGEFPDIFLAQTEYKVVLTDADGVEQWTADPVSPAPDNSTTITSYYDLPVFFNSKPTAGETYPIYNVPRGLQLPAGLTGSLFTVDSGTLPTATATFTLQKNGISIGTVAFSTLGAVTITFASNVTFNAGDQFSILCPDPQDSTMNFIAMTFVFTVL